MPECRGRRPCGDVLVPMGSFSADDVVQHAAAMRSLARDLLHDDATTAATAFRFSLR